MKLGIAALPLVLVLGCAAPGEDDGRPGGTRRAPPAPAVRPAPATETPPAPPTTGTPGPTTPGPAACASPDPGPWVLRRLTPEEYDNSIRDLTGDARALAAQALAGEFWNPRRPMPPVTTASTETYLRLAADISEVLIATRGAVQVLAVCQPGPACARMFIDRFATRAYRRPLQPEEIAILEEAYQAAAPDGPPAGLRAVALAVLQAPQFLYRLEAGQPRRDGERWLRLTAWETAARLSYHFWGTLPDAELNAAAQAGALDSAEQVAAQAARLATDPRARDRVRSYQRGWLELDRLDTHQKDADTFPEFTEALRADLRSEIERDLDDAFWDPRSDLRALLTAPQTFVNQRLATHYGLSQPPTSGFQRVPLDPAHHAGLLTRGPLMAMLANGWETSPVARGAFVLNNLLCADLPPPPANVNVEPPRPLPPDATLRERLEEHSSNPTCATCHAQIDPLGFALETFDGLGRFRATDRGKPIDTHGRVEMLPDKPPFADARELSRLLAEAPQTRACLVRTWFELTFARRPDAETDTDACSLQAMDRRFAAGGLHLRDLFLAATETDAFRFRRPDPGGQP